MSELVSPSSLVGEGHAVAILVRAIDETDLKKAKIAVVPCTLRSTSQYARR